MVFDDFDKENLMKDVRKFTKRELNRAAGYSENANGVRKQRERQIESLLDNEKLRKRVIERIVEIRGQTCPIDVNDDAQISELANRITQELDEENPPVDYDSEGRIRKADRTGKDLFERMFKAACNGKLNPINDKPVYSKGWSSIGDDGKQKWNSAQKKLAKVYAQYLKNGGETGDKCYTFNGTGANSGKELCPYCYSVRQRFYTEHILLHFPLNKTSDDVKQQMNGVIADVKSDDGFSNNLHKRVLAFHSMLYSNDKSVGQLKSLDEIKQLYEQMMIGDKDHKLYFLTQLIEECEALPKDRLAKAVFRYNGKAAQRTRHFRWEFNQGVSGNVGRQIALMIKSHVAHEGADIKESDRLYCWEALKVPTKSAGVLEQAITSGLWHLTERNSNYWNMHITSSKPDDPFAGVDPETLIYVGLYAIYLVIASFSAQTVKQTSQELLTTYDAFSNKERQSFNSRYKIGIGDERDSQFAILLKALQDVQLEAETQNNDRILQICNQPQVMALLNPNQNETVEFEDNEMDID